MEWPIIVALCIGIPFLILPAGFAWFVLVSSLYRSWHDARHRTTRTARRSPIDVIVRGFTEE